MKTALFVIGLWSTALAFSPARSARLTTQTTSTQLFGLFDGKFSAFGSASKQDLDQQWEAQQEILRNRRKPQAERDAYFEKIEQRRAEATKKQQQMWSWQTKQYKKGEDPIDEWKKRREEGTISDLDNQYGDEKKIGGIPLPMASFGVGGEFGVGAFLVCLMGFLSCTFSLCSFSHEISIISYCINRRKI